jgi:hypothetical protein
LVQRRSVPGNQQPRVKVEAHDICTPGNRKAGAGAPVFAVCYSNGDTELMMIDPQVSRCCASLFFIRWSADASASTRHWLRSVSLIVKMLQWIIDIYAFYLIMTIIVWVL